MDEIKKCKCGGEGELKHTLISHFIIDEFYIECKSCGDIGPLVKAGINGRVTAIKLWNERSL